ncbi:YigZ family protein [Oceanithermus sp.]|uniref:IMPACT family protein n=1 Tax=Oceanithermus sp. TaxID=2268145 RepID=UPI00257B9F2B|nr:YigZ family protein [Oceanithermus sp.]
MNPQRPLRTLAEPAGYEEEIKKSRFVCFAARADDAEEARLFLESVKDPSATHNCWAYRIGPAYRFSDDGEPGGTAGQPILRAIEGHGLDHVVVVVTRYFGGVKLGAGGLARAYGGVAAECLRRARILEIQPQRRLMVAIPYALSAKLYPILVAAGARRLGEAYASDHLVWEVEVDAARVPELEAALRDASKGSVRVQPLE